MSEVKRYEVRITGRITAVVVGVDLSEDAACRAAKADADAGDFVVDEASAIREVPESDLEGAIWNADIFLDLDPGPNPTGTGRRVL